MVSIATIGNGFIGSNIAKDLSTTIITRESLPASFDIVINANGNSKKYLADTDPLLDFQLNVESVLKSIINFSCKTYIYLSTCEVYNDSRYGFHKHLAEEIVQKYCPNWLILRLNGVIGPNMRKGPVYDIIKGDSLRISSKSEFQLIHTKTISKFISLLLEKNVSNETFNVTGKKTVSLEDIMFVLRNYVDAPENPVIKHSFNVENKYMDFPLSINVFNHEIGIKGTL